MKKHHIEQRPVIRFLTVKGIKPKDIQTKLQKMYERWALEIGTIQIGNDFSCGGESIFR
jgi:hypothetical protein